MDGLLIDSEPLWTVAEEELARDLGGTWDAEVKAQIVGTRLDHAVPTILRHYGVDDGPEQVAASSAWLLDRMVELFSDPLVVLPGAGELLAALDAAGRPGGAGQLVLPLPGRRAARAGRRAVRHLGGWRRGRPRQARSRALPDGDGAARRRPAALRGAGGLTGRRGER